MNSLPQLRSAGAAFWTPDGVLAWRRRINPGGIVMGVIFLGALVVGYALLPGDNERIAMLERDGQNKQALAILEQRYKAGDRSQRTLFQLQRLYEHFGELDKARQTLETLAEQRPKDPLIQRQLAQFYKQTQNEAGYLVALGRQLATRYSEPACKELIGLHRSNGDFDNEQRAVENCRRMGYRRPDDIVRLAYLVAADGKLTEAAALLRSVDDRRRLQVDRDRHMFFVALIEGGQAVEAQRRALRWLKGSKDQMFALELIERLVDEKQYDLAVDLAREVGKPGDAVSLAIAELLLDRNQEVAARTYLRGWFDAAKLQNVDLVHQFIAAALDADDPELAFRGAERFGLSKLGQRELVGLAEALSAINQRVLFEKVREVIEPQTVSENPLLAAAIELERGATEPARQLLARVQVDGLDEWKLALWARLMETTGRRIPAVQSLRQIGVEPPPAGVNPTKAIRRLKDVREKREQRAQRRQRARQAPVGGPKQPPPVVQPRPGKGTGGGGGGG